MRPRGLADHPGGMPRRVQLWCARERVHRSLTQRPPTQEPVPGVLNLAEPMLVERARMGQSPGDPARR